MITDEMVDHHARSLAESMSYAWHDAKVRRKLRKVSKAALTAALQGLVVVPAVLTAENGAKSALAGDFTESFEYMDDEGDECTAHIPVSWATIKAIHKAMVAHFTASPVPRNDGGSNKP